MTRDEAVEILRRMRTAVAVGSPESDALGMAAVALRGSTKERDGNFIDRIADKVVEIIAQKLLEEAEA